MRFLLALFTFIVCIHLVSTAGAYTSTDDSLLGIKLDKGFMPVGPSEKTDSSITMEFARANSALGLIEKFKIASLKKPLNTPADEFVQKQYLAFVAGLTTQPLFNQISALTPLPQKNSPFSAWFMTAQSQKLSTSIVTFFLDADAATVYIVIYMVNRYLSPEELQAAIVKTKTDINQVCYKTEKCYAIQ